MFNISPMKESDVFAASVLITQLRIAMNGRAVCTPNQMVGVLSQSLFRGDYTGMISRIAKTNQIVGYLGLNKRFAIYAGGSFGQVTELFVDPVVRRLGCGEGLLAEAEKSVVDFGGSSMEIGAPDALGHPGTFLFYQDAGYSVVGPRLSKTLQAH
jgi:GNAT superfamily N-acetyltransferase